MTPLLKTLLPGSVVIGEEAASNDPKIFDLLEGDAPVWIIDPVDGTSNFAKGGRHFCVMVGLVQGDEILLGVILDPLGERWVGAEKGAGAWSHAFNGNAAERLSTMAPVATAEMCGALNFRFIDSPLKEEMRARADAGVARHFRMGCAGHEYLRMASAEAHFGLYIKKMPWDHVPGCLIHTEAGGYHACFNGEPYRPNELDHGILAAPDRESWQALHEVLFGSSGQF